MTVGVTRAAQNRKIRQEALREELRNRGLLQQVIETNEKIADLTKPLDSGEVFRLKTANETRLKLINKYLPDLKQSDIELSGDEDSPLKFVVEFVGSQNQDS